jgi:uncharacterized protein
LQAQFPLNVEEDEMNASLVMSTEVAPESSHQAIAPAWHTATVLLILFGFSYVGARYESLPDAHGRLLAYVATIAMEWSLVAFIWYGVSRRGVSMHDLAGGRWAGLADVLRDLGITAGFLLVSGALLQGVVYLLKAENTPGLLRVLPQNSTEMILWLIVSLTAGFCEEIIFRGYFQRQFAALTQTSAGGIMLQGVVFGLGHGYQGWKLMVMIAVFGIMFGLLAHWRRSLRPGMIAHFVRDAAGGIAWRYLMH